MKLYRWLRSRPLAQVRRNLATRRRVAGVFRDEPLLSAEIAQVARRLRKNCITLYSGPI